MFSASITERGATLLVVEDDSKHVFGTELVYHCSSPIFNPSLIVTGAFSSEGFKKKPSFCGQKANFLFSIKPQIGVYSPRYFTYSCFDSKMRLKEISKKFFLWIFSGLNENYQYFNSATKTLPNGLVVFFFFFFFSSQYFETLFIFFLNFLSFFFSFLLRWSIQGFGGQFNYFGLWIDENFGTGHSKAKPLSTTFNSPRLSGTEEFKISHMEAWCLLEPVVDPNREDPNQKGVLESFKEDRAILEMSGRVQHAKTLRAAEDTVFEDDGPPPPPAKKKQ